jgi:hypothetical protein
VKAAGILLCVVDLEIGRLASGIGVWMCWIGKNGVV